MDAAAYALLAWFCVVRISLRFGGFVYLPDLEWTLGVSLLLVPAGWMAAVVAACILFRRSPLAASARRADSERGSLPWSGTSSVPEARRYTAITWVLHCCLVVAFFGAPTAFGLMCLPFVCCAWMCRRYQFAERWRCGTVRSRGRIILEGALLVPVLALPCVIAFVLPCMLIGSEALEPAAGWIDEPHSMMDPRGVTRLFLGIATLLAGYLPRSLAWCACPSSLAILSVALACTAWRVGATPTNGRRSWTGTMLAAGTWASIIYAAFWSYGAFESPAARLGLSPGAPVYTTWVRLGTQDMKGRPTAVPGASLVGPFLPASSMWTRENEEQIRQSLHAGDPATNAWARHTLARFFLLQGDRGGAAEILACAPDDPWLDWDDVPRLLRDGVAWTDSVGRALRDVLAHPAFPQEAPASLWSDDYWVRPGRMHLPMEQGYFYSWSASLQDARRRQTRGIQGRIIWRGNRAPRVLLVRTPETSDPPGERELRIPRADALFHRPRLLGERFYPPLIGRAEAFQEAADGRFRFTGLAPVACYRLYLLSTESFAGVRVKNTPPDVIETPHGSAPGILDLGDIEVTPLDGTK